MSTQPYVVALIQKDAVEHLPVTVFAHELPVLAAVHGEEKVFVDESADLPNGLTEGEFDPAEEYTRLEQRYGVDPDTKQSFARMVFGGLNGFEDFLENEAVGRSKPKRAKQSRAKKSDIDGAADE